MEQSNNPLNQISRLAKLYTVVITVSSFVKNSYQSTRYKRTTFGLLSLLMCVIYKMATRVDAGWQQ